ncbi:MAG: hypothetical protein HGA70_08305 [Chlorobiaceae bacterium]|nr:hypothetical protein [Chlorobiaceae bacterium]
MKHTAEIAVRRTVIQKNCGWNENKNSIQGNERHSAFIFMILPRLFFPGITPVMPVAMIAGSSIAMPHMMNRFRAAIASWAPDNSTTTCGQ